MNGVSSSFFFVDFTENSDECRTKDCWEDSMRIEECEVDSAVSAFACNRSTGCDTQVGFGFFQL